MNFGDEFGNELNAFLLGGFNHLEKYEVVNGKDDIPYIMENKKMFQTTNQIQIFTFYVWESNLTLGVILGFTVTTWELLEKQQLQRICLGKMWGNPWGSAPCFRKNPLENPWEFSDWNLFSLGARGLLAGLLPPAGGFPPLAAAALHRGP